MAVVLAVGGLTAALLVAGPGNRSADAAQSVTTRRFSGPTRYETATDIATKTFSSAADVVLARGDLFPDALAANAFAGGFTGPVLLTPPGSLPAAVPDALSKLTTKRVHIVGDQSAVSAAVETDLRTRGYVTDRTAGATRYETAVALAAKNTDNPIVTGRGRTVLLTSGESFPDAIAAAPLSYSTRMPLLLTTKAALPSSTEQFLKSRAIETVVLVGGTSAIAGSVETRLNQLGIRHERVAGNDRTATASAIGWWAHDVLGWSNAHLNLARGDLFADAIAGGAHAGSERAPLLLTPSPTSLGPATADFIGSSASTLTSIDVFGDQGAVADSVVAAAADAATTAVRCPGSAFPLDYAATSDSRVCVTVQIGAHTLRSGQGTTTLTLTAQNRSTDVIDISHPSGCAIWFGLFDDAGHQVAGGPSVCSAGATPDALAPSQTKTWSVELHTCYGRSGSTGSNCLEGAAVAGAFKAGAGLNIGAANGLSANKVWYAPTQPVFAAT